MGGKQINSTFNDAIAVLYSASSTVGIKASSEITDNYNRIWSRDAAVSALAILSNQIVALYPSIKSSIIHLQKAAAVNGQIPSNVIINEDGEMTGVSFGGPVGRTDASFWWVIMSLSYLNHQVDDELRTNIYHQVNAIFKLSDAWEFNGKNLMYVPMSSNWADEYITHGYVLYDQILRYWALDLAGSFYNRDDWKEKASAVKKAIQYHYLLEGNNYQSLYTQKQQSDLQNFDLTNQFIASFSPGDRIESFDGWSVGLLLMLKIPSNKSLIKLEQAILKIFEASQQKGIPAFYPIITEDNPLFKDIQSNYSYQFKNFPGHFHNGGIWPVVNGFLIAGLNQNGFVETAKLLQTSLDRNLKLHQQNHPFSEYFCFYDAKPGGVKNLCYSASGYLIGKSSSEDNDSFKQQLFHFQLKEEKINQQISARVKALISKLPIRSKFSISVAGESGCGKTTLSRALKEHLEQQNLNVIILHQDEYFKLPPKKNHQARERDFEQIGPQEARLELLDEHIRKIKESEIQTLAIPHMDWLTDAEEQRLIDVRNVDIIIVEGTYTSLLKTVDQRIFINTNYQFTKQNRINRNREKVTDFIEKVLEKESSIIQKHLKLADLVLDKQLNIIS